MSDNLEEEKKEEKKEEEKEKTLDDKKEKSAPKKEPEENNQDSTVEKLKTVALFILPVILLVIVLFASFTNVMNVLKGNKEELEKNFKITKVTPKNKGKYIDNNETFVIETTAADEDIVRKHLFIEPSVNYDIKKINKGKYEVTLNNVESDSLVNISYVKNEVKNYSWAFQTTKDLKVTSIYPAAGSSAVSTSSTIEIVLSYPEVKDLPNHFEISPKVEGEFENFGNLWIFKPNQELKDKTTYTVTIKEGLKYGDYTLEEPFVSTFSTYNKVYIPQEGEEGPSRNYSATSIDGILTFKPSERPVVQYYTYMIEDYSIGKVKISKFNSADDFIKFLSKDKSYKLGSSNEVKFITEKNNVALEEPLAEGYYIEEVYLEGGELFSKVPIQVNEISAYMLNTNDDMVIWAGSGTQLLENINVNYNGKNYKTDKNGLATIKNYLDDTKKMKYVKVGDKTPLVIGASKDVVVSYPEAYIYTDRPLYKNTDTINIWGYIPLNLYKEKVSDFDIRNFTLKFVEEQIPLKINEDGTFNAKFELDNYMDDSSYVVLEYKNNFVASKGTIVANYTKQNYEYDVKYEKNFGKPGETLGIDIEVTHVSGIKVQNKQIIINYKGKNIKASTDSNGIAHYNVKLEYNSTEDYLYDNYYSPQSITVKVDGSEYSENNFSMDVFVICKDRYIKETKYDKDTRTVTAVIDKINPNKYKGLVSYENINELLTDGKASGTAELILYEEKIEREIVGKIYNKFTKEYVNDYHYSYSDNVIDTKKINYNGTVEYKVDKEFKESTDDVGYIYYANVRAIVGDKQTEVNVWFNSYDYSERKDNYIYKSNWQFSAGQYVDEAYYLYEYYIDRDANKEKFSIGENLGMSVKQYNQLPVSKDGKILRINLKNKVMETKILNGDEDFDVKFKESDYPGGGYTGAIFLDGKIYRLPVEYFDFNEKDKETKITIETDKKEYKPRDKVKAKIKVTDKDGKGIKTAVNVSVVDKAVFNVIPDYTPIVSNIYSDMFYKAYTYASFRNYDMTLDNGGMGGTGSADGGRTKFSDTILFKSLETNASGEVELEFELNDSITSFVITVHTANKDNYVGVAKQEISSTLPLSLSVIEPKGLKSTDDVVISTSALGSTKSDIKFTFTIDDKKLEKTGKVGNTIYANFGPLAKGTHEVTIEASDGTSNDKITFPFTVSDTHQEMAIKTTSDLKNLKNIKPTKNPIILEFYKSGFDKYINYLETLLEVNEDRLDTRVAYLKALELSNKYYGYDYPITINNMAKFESKGVLRYLENETPSEVVTALVNYYYPGIYKLEDKTFYEKLSKTTNANVAIDNLLVLASMRKPVLDEIDYINSLPLTDFSNTGKAKIALAYAFIGDYTKAKKVYKEVETNDDTRGILAIVSTFVDKGNATKKIDELYGKDNANRYLYFAMLSFFKNNETDLSKESTITVEYKNKKETIKIKGFMVKKLIINNKDLSELKINSTDDKDRVRFYYEGGLDEIAEDKKVTAIKTTMSSNLSVGNQASMKVDLSKMPQESFLLKVYLPNSLRLSGYLENTKGIYLSSNQGEYLVFYVSKERQNTFDIPLYVSYPGKYKIEEVVAKIEDTYYISNSLDIDIK